MVKIEQNYNKYRRIETRDTIFLTITNTVESKREIRYSYVLRKSEARYAINKIESVRWEGDF